jgi:tryptophan-rich sensory protein
MNEIPDVSLKDNIEYLRSSENKFLKRLRRYDFWLLFLILIVLLVINIVIVIIGSVSSWYKNLKKLDFRSPFSQVCWIISTLATYFALYLLWEEFDVEDVPLDFFITALYILGSFIVLMWGTAFYFFHNLVVSVVLNAVILLYKIALFVYIWKINKIAAIFLIPLMIMYAYQLASTIYILNQNVS